MIWITCCTIHISRSRACFTFQVTRKTRAGAPVETRLTVIAIGTNAKTITCHAPTQGTIVTLGRRFWTRVTTTWTR